MIAIGVAPQLRGELRELAAGRAVIVDYFVSARCGVAVGDLTADFGVEPSVETHARLEDIDGVPVFAERRLLPLLDESGPSIERRRLLFGSAIGLRLDRPERWLAFLERPGVAVGKRPLDQWRHISS